MGNNNKKQTLNIPLSMVKLLITLWMVYGSPVTTKIQACFLTQLLERKETAQGFHNEANGDFKTVTEFNGCDRRKLRIDQRHCSYSTILTQITV
jgi:hypothetical protein